MDTTVIPFLSNKPNNSFRTSDRLFAFRATTPEHLVRWVIDARDRERLKLVTRQL